MIMLGITFYWRGRQYSGLARGEAIDEVEDDSVLYLRPFSTDLSLVRHVVRYLNPITQTRVILSGFATQEELLGEAVRPVGELIAIGNPDKSLPAPVVGPASTPRTRSGSASSRPA